jgi:hypothetical protein
VQVRDLIEYIHLYQDKKGKTEYISDQGAHRGFFLG